MMFYIREEHRDVLLLFNFYTDPFLSKIKVSNRPAI